MEDPPEQRLRRRTRRRRAITSGVIVLVALTGLLALMLNRHDTAAAGAGDRADGSAAMAIRNQAAAWVAGEVSRAATVSCDPVMCQALRAHGIPAASLLELRPGAADPLRSSVIVATAAVRGTLGSRYLANHAPAAIAAFGSGTARISIRVIAPQGAASYLSALGADVAARQAWAVPLLRSKHIMILGPARSKLAEGRVDPRLLVDIASLAAQRPLSIVAFGDSAPGASPGIPLRSAWLAGTSAAGKSPAAQVQWMSRFLHAQRGDYLPASIQPVPLAAGGTGLQVEFAAPSPLGLLKPLAP